MSEIVKKEQDYRLSEPNFRDFLHDIWKAKVFMLLGAIIGLLAAFIFQSFTIPHYKSEILLAPASPMTGAESSSLLANDNLFAIRYIAQRIGGGGSGSDFQRFENMVFGPSVAQILLQDKKITSGLKTDRSFTFSEVHENWSAELLSEYLKDRIKLKPVGVTTARKMEYLHSDAAFSEYLLTGLHHVADSLIRRDIRQDAQARVDYLSKAIQETGNPEHRRALTTLLMEQERLLMLVSIDQPYAASVIEPASSSVKPAWPDLYLLYLGLPFICLCLGFIIHGMRRA